MEIIQQINELIETNQSLKEENRKFTDTLDEKDEAIKRARDQEAKIDNEWMEMNEKQDEEIKKQKEEIKNLTKSNQTLDTKLIQISSQVGLHDKRLSQEVNSLTSKLANREKQIKELKEQIDQTKINALEAKDNEIAVLKEDINFHCETFENQIAVLKQKNKELESQQGKAQEKAKTSLQAIFTEFMISVNQSGFVKHKVMIGRYNNGKAKYKTFYMAKEVSKHLDDYPQVGKEMARVSHLVDTM